MRDPFRRFRSWHLIWFLGLSLVVVGLSQSASYFESKKSSALQPVPLEKLPRYGTFWSLQRTNYAPWPCYPPFLREASAPVFLLNGERNVYLVDDSAFDYATLYKKREEQRQERLLGLNLGLMSEEEYWSLEGGGPEPMGYSYGPEDFWIELRGVTNGYAYLTLHGTVYSSTDWYQVLTKTNLAQAGEWTMGELLQGYPGTNQTDLSPVSLGEITNMFFRGQHQSGYVFIQSSQHAYESNAVFTAANGGVTVQSTFANDVTVNYRISGTASNGADYVSPSGTLAIRASTGLGTIEVQPISDGLAEGEETVTITLIQTNIYLISPNAQSRTIAIYDISTTVQLWTDPNTSDLIEPDGPPGSPAVGAELLLYREDSRGLFPALEVPYSITGTASNGADFTLLTGVATFPEDDVFAYINLNPLSDNLVEGIENVVITLLPTNTFSISPGWDSATCRIADSSTAVSVYRDLDAIEPATNGASGITGIFRIERSDTRGVYSALPVAFQIGGAATHGVDYTNITASVTFLPGELSTNIFIQPLYDGIFEGDESLSLRLSATSDDYFQDGNSVQTMMIIDNPYTNVFVPVVTNLPAPVGIDYHQPSNSLIVSFNYYGSGQPSNFLQFYTNTVLSNIVTVITNWSGVHGVSDEIKLVTVKTNLGGFTNGDMYFSSGTGIGWISADATRSNLNWCVLTNSVQTNAMPIRGGLCLDVTGIFSNQLIVVTSQGDPDFRRLNKGVWRVSAQGIPTLITNITTPHLEGVITLPNDAAKWGPWAGKIITGDEGLHVTYAIAPNGSYTYFSLGIDTEDFDIIPPNQDLYGCDLFGNALVKLSRNYLTNLVGELLITDAGEVGPPGKVFIVSWNAATSSFAVRRILYKRPDGSNGLFEHVSFAPIDFLPVTP